MERITLFTDVLLPLPLPALYTYRVPFELNDEVKIGKRVIVQFGKQKIYTAIIKKIHETPPSSYNVKYILSVLDEGPVVNNIQLEFWDWLAKYYMCTPGEVMNAAVPSGLKLESETKISLHPDFNKDYSALNNKEYMVVEALEFQDILSITEISKILNLRNVVPILKTLIEKKVIQAEEEVTNKYKPKTEKFVRLTPEYQNEEKLKELFDTLGKKAYKQLEIIISFIKLSKKQGKPAEVIYKDLLKDSKAISAQINSLIKKKVFEIFEKNSDRIEQYNMPLSEISTLNNYQEQAYGEIKEHFKSKDVVLLHGVTSSGKTEIYIKLIDEAVKQGKQVLYLLPEIALTTQIINRLHRNFGNIVGVYHSRFSNNERVEVWNNVIASEHDNTKYRIILGARSAVFLPFSNLGLVIIDEEHDGSYKQYDPAPRYNGRDAAIYLAHLHKAKILLGSATPSVESYYNAETGKYALIELNKRYGDVRMPEILVVDIKAESKQKKMKSHFSSFLLEKVQEALDNKEQIILFQNRRGFSLHIECDICNWIPKCKNCDVTLTYHKHSGQLRCHYCGYSAKLPHECIKCKSPRLSTKGFGTEKIEEELPAFFPKARIARMDLDTTRSKNAYLNIINDFESRKIDILVGTQMLTKGLDFDNVSIVGILNADNMFNFPDFRTFEKSFQQIAQVSGRAGRKNKQGKVIIQSFNPYHSVIQYAVSNDYLSMYKSQILERRNFRYPPFYRLIKITLKHKDQDILNEAAPALAKEIRQVFSNNVLGPEYPVIPRIKNYYLKDILVKLEKISAISSSKLKISKLIDCFLSSDKYKSVKTVIDVDPL